MSTRDGENELNLDVLGRVVRMTFPHHSADYRGRLAKAWSGAVSSDGQHANAVMAIEDAASGLDLAELTDIGYETLASNLSTRVTLRGIELSRGESLMLHAAGIALPDGRVVAFVAPSGSGKTTLSSVLGKRFGYVSDETVLVERDLTVKPYRKPLSVIRDPEQPRRKTQISPDEIGLKQLPEAPLKLAAIVLFYRDEDNQEATVEAVPLPDAVQDLSGQISYFGDIPDSVAMLASIVEKTGGIRVLKYREAEEVVDLVDEILRVRIDDASWTDVSLSSTAPNTLGKYVRCPEISAVETGNAVITMSGNTLRVLAGLSPVIWELTGRGASLHEIREALIEEFGEPEDDADALTQRALEALMEQGLLEYRAPQAVANDSPSTG